MPSQGGEPMRTAPVGRPRRNEKQWTAWTRDSGRRDGSTGSRYVRSSRPVKPSWRSHNRWRTAHRHSSERPVATRHADVCPHRGKKTDGLWTTACWGPRVWVASPSAGRLPYPPACDGHLLPRCPRDADGGPCVHRLWMTMWTGKVGVVHHGHVERDPGAIRLSSTVIQTRSIAQPAITERWKP